MLIGTFGGDELKIRVRLGALGTASVPIGATERKACFELNKKF